MAALGSGLTGGFAHRWPSHLETGSSGGRGSGALAPREVAPQTALGGYPVILAGLARMPSLVAASPPRGLGRRAGRAPLYIPLGYPIGCI